MDPWMTGLMALFAGQNPQQAGPLLDAAGVPPPDQMMKAGGPGLGEMMPGDVLQGAVAPGSSPALMPAAAATAGPQGAMGGQVVPEPSGLGGPGGALGTSDMAKLALAGMQAAKPAPIMPIMNGGVSGGVKPPEVSAGVKGAQAPAINALMQALLQRSSPSVAPGLGALLPR